MTEVLTLALTFPSVVFTILLGVVLIYWAFVMVGALHIGEGSDGALDGLDAGNAIAGASKGALEGAAKGALEGATKGVLEGATDALGGHHGGIGDALGGHHGADALGGHHGGIGDALGGHHGADALGGHHGMADRGGDGDVDVDDFGGDGSHPSVLAALLSALRLRQIPATIALSVLITFCWLVSVVAMQIAMRLLPWPPAAAIRWAVLLLSPVLALPMSGIVCIPLSKVLVQRKPPTKSALIGVTCRIRTGKVTERFGEATLEDGGAGLVVRVRVSGESPLKRGDLALIVDFDKDEDSFLVEPMDSVLGTSKR